MADPRLTTNRFGIDTEEATFQIDGTDITYDATVANGSPRVGRAVRISANGVVRLSGDAEAVHGQLKLVRPDGFCNVVFDGFVGLPGGNGATLTPGSKIVGAVDAGAIRGCIRSVAAATLAEVAVARHSISDSSDATNVEVMLD